MPMPSFLPVNGLHVRSLLPFYKRRLPLHPNKAFLLDGVLYTLLFGAVMVVLHRNAPEFNQLKGRVTAVLKRRES